MARQLMADVGFLHQLSHTLCFVFSHRRPTSTLFPYTTLFRSRPAALPARGSMSPSPTESRATRPEWPRSEEHTPEPQSLRHIVCRLLLEQKKSAESASLHHKTKKHRQGSTDIGGSAHETCNVI